MTESNGDALVSALASLVPSEPLGTSEVQALLALYDRSTDPRVREAALEVLLFADDEEGVVAAVESRWTTEPLSDSTLRILIAFPAHGRMLSALASRYDGRSVEAHVAAHAFQTLVFDTRSSLPAVERSRVARVLTAQLNHDDPGSRRHIVMALLSSRDGSVPASVEEWWPREFDSGVRCSALAYLCNVGPENRDWAIRFLRNQMQTGLSAEELVRARESLQALNPED